MLLSSSITGHDIAPKFCAMVTKAQKSATKFTTKAIPYILTLCIEQSSKASRQVKQNTPLSAILDFSYQC